MIVEIYPFRNHYYHHWRSSSSSSSCFLHLPSFHYVFLHTLSIVVHIYMKTMKGNSKKNYHMLQTTNNKQTKNFRLSVNFDFIFSLSFFSWIFSLPLSLSIFSSFVDDDNDNPNMIWYQLKVSYRVLNVVVFVFVQDQKKKESLLLCFCAYFSSNNTFLQHTLARTTHGHSCFNVLQPTRKHTHTN